jgi:hypothetical protein
MIIGRSPRNPIIGDTVLLRAEKKQGIGTIVDTDAIRYRVYRRNGPDELSWHARAELTVPRLDYGRHYNNFSNPGEAITYGYGLCDKVSRGEGYAQVMGEVKGDVVPNDEFAANYLVSYAVNLLCPAQIWQLRNSAAHYQPPPGEDADTASISTRLKY